MKGKRHATEQKIRILREANGGRNIVEVCKEHNISEVTFHRWKRQFGQLDVNEAKRMKELERENAELKKMLADSLLKNRVLEAVNAKNGAPGAQTTEGHLRGRRRSVLRADGVPGLWAWRGQPSSIGCGRRRWSAPGWCCVCTNCHGSTRATASAGSR